MFYDNGKVIMCLHNTYLYDTIFDWLTWN